MPEYVIGAEPVQLKGPISITHDGGDDLIITSVDALNNLPAGHGDSSLTYNGADSVDEIFVPAPVEERTLEFEGDVSLRARGQANISVRDIEPQAPPKKAAPKKVKKVKASA